MPENTCECPPNLEKVKVHLAAQMFETDSTGPSSKTVGNQMYQNNTFQNQAFRKSVDVKLDTGN